MLMSDLIINWHPIFVHFTVALITMSFIFYWLGRFVPSQRWQHEFAIVGRWCLWTGSIITIITISLGFNAYYTVAHDDISHAVMTTHRNWAVIAFILLWLVTLWSLFIYRRNKKPSWVFLSALFVVVALVTVTAWYGGELVFRNGVGVISTPEKQKSPKQGRRKTGHSHQGAHQHAH